MKKILLAALIALALVSCGNTALNDLNGPVILVAKTTDGDVVVRATTNRYLAIAHDFSAAKAIAACYEPGDTLK